MATELLIGVEIVSNESHIPGPLPGDRCSACSRTRRRSQRSRRRSKRPRHQRDVIVISRLRRVGPSLGMLIVSSSRTGRLRTSLEPRLRCGPNDTRGSMVVVKLPDGPERSALGAGVGGFARLTMLISIWVIGVRCSESGAHGWLNVSGFGC